MFIVIVLFHHSSSSYFDLNELNTVTPNSGLGSDHAWGGNAFVWGGQISGSKILGQYPTSFDNSDVTQIGRGRLIPFRSWESLWYGVSNWFGITDGQDMQYVLPNNGNMG